MLGGQIAAGISGNLPHTRDYYTTSKNLDTDPLWLGRFDRHDAFNICHKQNRLVRVRVRAEANYDITEGNPHMMRKAED